MKNAIINLDKLNILYPLSQIPYKSLVPGERGTCKEKQNEKIEN
jgi:hypothetical protein